MAIILMGSNNYFISGYWWLLVIINSYFIIDYWWLLYWWLSMAITLVVIDGYYIGGY